MKALILAAGLGSRLAPITNTCPKSLVSVNGMPILLKQIAGLTENGITDITVISGYKGEVLEAAVAEQYPKVQIVRNTEYADTNNMYSAWLGRETMAGNDFLMMNADVFFDASVIAALLNFKAPNAIVTDLGVYLEESMKVIAAEDGRICRISKTISEAEMLGTSIDVYKFSRDGGAAFFAKCEEYIVSYNDRKKWSEVALNDILSQVYFEACPLVGRWIEIDDQDDLTAAQKLFSE